MGARSDRQFVSGRMIMNGRTVRGARRKNVRTQKEKWQVPESDPAGQKQRQVDIDETVRLQRTGAEAISDADPIDRAGLIYCGQCGALNPRTNHFCAACGGALLDAFHASEGLRVYDRPDTASRLIEIVAAGAELDIVDDVDAPDDFVRVKLSHGRLGYIRLEDVDALAQAPARPALGSPDVNIAARGCVTQTSALAALLLMVVLGALVFYYVKQSDTAETGIVALAACFTIGPLIAVTIGLYVFARSRDERLAYEAEEIAEQTQTQSGQEQPK